MTTNPTSETTNPTQLTQFIDGQLLTDFFLTMAHNIHTLPRTGPLENRKLVDNLSTLIDPEDNLSLYRDWNLRMKISAHVAGALIMRHGANPYLEEIEAGVPTVNGVLTSLNCETGSFCVDPGEGRPDKDREVAVIPFGPRTLQQQVTIELLNVGPA